MKIFVTGATGFVGSHIVAALVGAGHEVSLLVRRAEQVPVTFAPHGITPTDLVVGDVRDTDVVAGALDGCDAAVHAAAIFSLRSRDAEAMAATNMAATRTVLGASVRAGVDPIVYISSTVVLARRGGMSKDLPLGDLEDAYSLSKIDAERVAREHQAAGAPVVTLYPGGVLGPHDPYLGEQANRVKWVARGLFPLWPRGGSHFVDVRDLAATVVACLQPGLGPRRYVVPGTHAGGAELFSTMSGILGRRRPHLDLPPTAAVALTRPIAALNALTPRSWHYPADADGVGLVARDVHFDDAPARAELGVTPRSFEDSLSDTVAWLVDAGHLPARLRPVGRPLT
jgi:nucleoside-diphosphate-sugar epimerase